MNENYLMVIIALIVIGSLQGLSMAFKWKDRGSHLKILNDYFNHLPKTITAKFVKLERRDAFNGGYFFYAIYEYNNQGNTYLFAFDYSDDILDKPKPSSTKVCTFPEDIINADCVIKSDSSKKIFDRYHLSEEAEKTNPWKNS